MRLTNKKQGNTIQSRIVIVNTTMSLQDILKTNNIIRVTPHDSLSYALAKLNTSHDSAFLFDDNKFIQ